MNMEFRKAEQADLAQICALVSAAIDNMISCGIFQWDEIYPTSEDFEQDGAKGQLYVGEANGRIAVVFTLNDECDEEYKTAQWEHPDEPYRVIHRLCVDPKCQNLGVARQTLEFIENELRAQGINEIRLDVYSKNPHALRLYEKAGYAQRGFADWRKGRFYLMEKHLGEQATAD